ncbi:response regulator transcription factor [Alkalilimnicola sp. S0819]|uniref:response regulator transcription factor n=1 Tax=Alkalilimnicola sp. S0819 TaxID=2613922 RepID=UPI0012629C53|nr:response regulator [Alkalilimnicola sp. S0819]KAB7622689.1 response regulator transcription factor [Alkalilimnicola sp. S0819]MPQ17327.1 response regulator [Alkalilimnicola sp. S0819]
MTDKPSVFIVDDEPDVRAALKLLVGSAGHAVESYPSAQAFLDALPENREGCLVLDVRMPGMSGLELQKRLAQRELPLPIIFISGHGDIPMAVRAMQGGAEDFLEKPFSDRQLLDRIEKALARSREWRQTEQACAQTERNLASLTPRETEVMEKLLEGKVNKIIARELDLSTRTVEIHRARVLQKMAVSNVTQLVGEVMACRKR